MTTECEGKTFKSFVFSDLLNNNWLSCLLG